MPAPGYHPLVIPTNCHPLVRQMFEAMNAQRVDTTSMEAAAGVSRSGIRAWQQHRMPRVDNLDACLNVLGLELTIQPRKP